MKITQIKSLKNKNFNNNSTTRLLSSEFEISTNSPNKLYRTCEVPLNKIGDTIRRACDKVAEGLAEFTPFIKWYGYIKDPDLSGIKSETDLSRSINSVKLLYNRLRVSGVAMRSI